MRVSERLNWGAFRICTASSARSRCGDVVRNDGWRGRQRSGRRQRYHTEKQRNGGRTENGLLRLCLRCSVSLRDTVASVFTVHSRPRAGTVPSRAQRHRDRRRPTLLALFGAVGFLLLIACVNVANLLIARGAARRHEIGVRVALGGGRLRLIRQLLVESTVVSGAGGVLGIAVGALLLRALVAAAPEGTPRLADVTLDRTALAFALGAAAVCGIVFGAFPAVQSASADSQHALLRGRDAGASAGSHRLRRGLIVFESALALMLLAGAGLMIRTVDELVRLDPGFRPDHVVTTQLT